MLGDAASGDQEREDAAARRNMGRGLKLHASRKVSTSLSRGHSELQSSDVAAQNIRQLKELKETKVVFVSTDFAQQKVREYILRWKNACHGFV